MTILGIIIFRPEFNMEKIISFTTYGFYVKFPFALIKENLFLTFFEMWEDAKNLQNPLLS